MSTQRPIPSSLLLMALAIFRKFCDCGEPAFALCDWKDLSHRSGTCDTPICAEHAKEVLPGKYLCPRHQLHYDRLQNGKRFSESEQRALFSEAA